MSFVSPTKMKLYLDEYVEKVLDKKYALSGSGSGDCYTKEEIDEMIGGIDIELDEILGE